MFGTRIPRTALLLLLAGLLALYSQIATSATCSRAIRIMPLGDSITVGKDRLGLPDSGYRVGYRQNLYQLLTNPGYEIDFVGSQSEGSLAPPLFDTNHEGHGGYRDDQIADNTYIWLENTQPDYVLLHVGTNAHDSNPADVERILNEVDHYNPDITVVLARIINRQNRTSTQFNNNVVAMAEARISNGDKIVIVDMENALDYTQDMSDNLHPNANGYEKMAQVWSTALLDQLSIRCSGAPQFISTPALRSSPGQSYNYQADLFGAGPVQFVLNSGPAGMTINSADGLVTWTPAITGIFNVSITATNLEGNSTQNFAVDVVPQIVIDNGDPGSIPTGTWTVSSGVNPYGSDSLYSRTAGASYAFESPVTDYQEVSLWWTAFSNRSSNVPVEIYDGNTLLDTVYVDQKVNGGQWNTIGSYAFTELARVVIQSSGAGSTSVDAMRLVPVDLTTPIITSQPALQGTVSTLYTYDVDAIGNSVLTYQLLSGPADMSIDPATGTITWIPSAVGNYPVAIKVSNTDGSVTQSFDITINDPSLELVIDNGDPGSIPTGTWTVSSGVNPYGNDSLYSRTAGANYAFEGLVTNYQAVSLWWTAFSNRSSNVPVEIYDGNTLLDTVYVDQKVNGGQWNTIGNYAFTELARIVIQSTGSGSTSADAMRLVPVDLTTPIITSQPVLQGIVSTLYTYDVNAIGNSVLTYQLLSGPADMSIDLTTGTITWIPSVVGNYPVAIEVSNTDDSVTQSFDIAINDPNVNDPNNGPSLELVIDNGDPGSIPTGTWTVSSGTNPYGNDSLYSKTAGASYAFESPVTGDQEVSLWWTAFSNRLSNVPVEIYDGNTLLGTVYIDQKVNGGQWNTIGNYTFTGLARIVIQSSGSGSTSADAARLVQQ